MRRVSRAMAIASVVAFALVTVLVIVVVLAQGDISDLPPLLAVCTLTAVSATIYGIGLAQPSGQSGRWLRIGGWLAMVAASTLLITFSFILWPLLLLALPYTLWRE